MNKVWLIFIVLQLIIGCKQANNRLPEYGYMVHIVDGDTMYLQYSGGPKLKVRLKDIDTPEKGQFYYEEAKEALFYFTTGKRLRVDGGITDKYGRELVYLYDGNTNINVLLVQEGYAKIWKYCKEPSNDLLLAEAYAKSLNKGVWKRN